MTILVTGSAGHLGEALVRRLRDAGQDVMGIDLKQTAFTDETGSILDRPFIRRCMKDASTVIHAATLHKPHVVTHDPQALIDTNITGTLTLLEEAASAHIKAFVLTSTTSVFGDALRPAIDAPAAWITEEVASIPRNIYGVTKAAAEDLSALFARNQGLPAIVLRTSRFFAEEDDSQSIRDGYADDNAKANEFLFRRVDLDDVVSAHLLAIERAPELGFGRYIISATTPFLQKDAVALRRGAQQVVERRVPSLAAEYSRRGWTMFPEIDRIYINAKARCDLGWQPRYDIETIIEALSRDDDPRSPLARLVGSKGYHGRVFSDGPYPVD
jgi:nucleoside-diphosphate-sugar epimerase